MTPSEILIVGTFVSLGQISIQCLALELKSVYCHLLILIISMQVTENLKPMGQVEG